MVKAPELRTDPVPPRAIVLDTETTGFTPKQGHRIVEIAAIELAHGRPTGQEFHAYVNPGRTVPDEAFQVHGLSEAFLRDKPRFSEISAPFLAFLGSPDTPVWAHNAPFDRRFVEAELEWAGRKPAHGFSCSMKLARALKLGLESVKLETLAAHMNYSWGGRGAHSALEDTRALGAVLSGLLWPREAELAREKDASPIASRTPRPRQKNASAHCRPNLPAGFTPIGSETDGRIRRYDDLLLEGRLFARGKKWTSSEEGELVRRFLEGGAEIPDLVDAHGRTPGALMLKLEALGVVAPGHPYARS